MILQGILYVLAGNLFYLLQHNGFSEFLNYDIAFHKTVHCLETRIRAYHLFFQSSGIHGLS